MWLMMITVLFLMPAYYVGKSKGLHMAWLIGIALAAVFGLVLVAAVFLEDGLLLGNLAFFVAPLFLLLVWLLPARKGAPGKAYLKITFDCPECGESVTFPRHREGVAVSCPKCAEIITVKEDGYSPVHEALKIERRPETTSGLVTLVIFGNPHAADILRGMLAAADVHAVVFQDNGGGTMPQINQMSGFRVNVDAGNWDAAVAVAEDYRAGEDREEA